MSNIWKRSLSLLLAIVMVIGMMPTNIVFAEENDIPGSDVVEETTEAPVEETTEASTEKETEAPVEETTEAPTEKETEAPVEETTEAPVEETTEAPVEETTEAPTEEETEAPKAELSGDTRKIYYYNVESWDEVWAAWSFDEEDFDDVAHPGEEMSAAAVLEDVYVVTVPVEADEVLFSDGIEVTEELLEQERLAGVSVTHEIEVRLAEDRYYDLYQNGAWANYAQTVKALEETEPETEAPAEHTCSYEGTVTKEATCEEAGEMTYACTCGESNTEVMPALGHEYAEGKCTRCGAADPVAEVQAMIDALPTSFNSQAEVDNFWDVTAAELDAAIEALTAEQQEQLDTSRYDAAIDAAAAFANPEFDNAGTWAVSVAAGGTATIEKKDSTTVGYNEMMNSVLSAPRWYTESGLQYREKNSNTEWTYKLTDVALEHGKTYEVQEVYVTIGSPQYSSSYYITFKVYHEPTVAVAEGAPEGAEASLAATKVYSGTNNATVNAKHVEGYKVTATYKGNTFDLTKNGDTWSGTFTATDSSAVTVNYVSDAVQPATIYFTVDSESVGSGSVNFGGLTETGTRDAGTYTLTVTPDDLDGSDGSAMYVEKVEVNGFELAGNYNAGIFTASYTVGNDESYTVKVTYGTARIENKGGILELNGYVQAGGFLQADNYYRWNNLKENILTAVLGSSDGAGEYTVSAWLNLVGDPAYRDVTNVPGTSEYRGRLEVPAEGETGTLKVKIVKTASSDGKVVALTLSDIELSTKESRASAGLNDYIETKAQAREYGSQDALTAYVTDLANGTAVNPKGLTVTVSTGSQWPDVAGVATKMIYTVKYEDSADYIGDEATVTVYAKAQHNNCTVVADKALTEGASLSVSGTVNNDNTTVPGNSTVTITVNPNSGKYVEDITVKNGDKEVQISEITYNNRKATVTFASDGAETADQYVVSAEIKDNYLRLNKGQTIVYCVDDENHTYDLQRLVFEAIYDSSSAPMTKDNVTLEFKSGLTDWSWKGLNDAPALALTGHKFGENGAETIRLKYSDEKHGSFEQEILLNVFDSCYCVEVGVQTITNGAEASIKTQFSADTKEFKGVKYFKAGTELTVTLTPDGDILGVLEQLYNGTYSESMAYIKDVRVYERGAEEPISGIKVVRGQGKLDLGSILQGVNPMLYNAAVTFTPEADKAYFVVAEYGILELERESKPVRMPMYQGGKAYESEVPTAQEIINEVLGEKYAASFLAAYGGAFSVDFSTDLISYKWTEISDDALLALTLDENDEVKIRVRITWKPVDGEKIYYPVAQQADLTLFDGRTPTSVLGEMPEKQVNFISEDRLIAELKEAMGLGITAEGSALNVAYTVTYTLKGNETDGFFADVTVTYDGSAEYKPTSKTFENVPVANRPDDATIKVTIQNAAAEITNNDGKIQDPNAETGLYTVIGNGTFNFKLIPSAGYAIESVTVTKSLIKDMAAAAAEEPMALEYNKQTATFSMALEEKYHYEVNVQTVDSKWILEDVLSYDFATGISKPDNSGIVETVTKYPTDIDFEKVSVEYLARSEGKVTVTLPDIDLGLYVIELGTFNIDLGELWLNPEESVDMVAEDQLDKILANLIDDVISKVSHGELAATNTLSYITEYVRKLPLGIHAFGAAGDGSVETVRFSYEDDKYLLEEVVTDITIHDYRAATEIVANDCEVTYGYSVADLIAASGAAVTSDGAAVAGLLIETNDLYKHAGDHTVTLFFKGDENYQPSKATVNVTVNKAPVSIDYDSQIITYGDDYNFGIAVAPTTLPDGTASNPDMIEFLIGLDAHKLLDLDISDEKIGLNQVIGTVQLRLPESIRNLPLVGDYLKGEFTLAEFTELINGLDEVLGIDENSMGILNQVLGAITGATDNMDIKVRITDKEFHPANIGVYIAGAVTVDADFETAYTADYLIIKARATEVELAWNETALTNAMVTLPVFNSMDKGASVVGEEHRDFPVNYLVLGVNTDTSEFLSTDIYGNIKANIWLSPDQIKENGAYVQIAFGVQWGNEFVYAVPIIRSFAIVPELYNVQLVGESGDPNNELLKKFNNKPHGFSVTVTDKNGNVIYSDHYQNAVPLRENAQLVINYSGIQTNGAVYNSSEKPVHAGVYAATAIYMEFIDGEKLDVSNLELEDLYELFNLADIGADAGLLVIEPSESSVTVESETHIFGTPYDLKDMVTVDSLNSDVTPDTTVIAAMIAATDDVSANGLAGITGSVNVDFPRWVDELIAQHVPGVKDGITVAELREKLLNNIPDISGKLEELGATSEMITSMSNLMGNVSAALEQLPDDVKLTFRDDVEVYAVGAYLVMAAVTDSDHYPAADAGVLIIAPDADKVNLKYEEDANNIFTPEALKVIDLGAKAYDPATGEEIEEATALVTNIFVGINAKGETVITDDVSTLDNGVYTQFSYILDVGGKMYYAQPIARVITLTPNTADVYFVDAGGNKNADQLFVFDNTAKSMAVEAIVNDRVFTPAAEDLTYNYVGVQTNGIAYNSSEAPVHAGVYAVTVSYSDYDENGKLLQFGAAVGAMAIEPAASTMDVTGGTVTYDGEGHTATVVATGSGVTEPDYTLISGGTYVSGDISEVGVDAFRGNVNIDFPAWLDKALAEHEFKTEGIDAAYLTDFISSYRDDALALIPVETLVKLGVAEEEINAYIAKLNGYIDELLAVLEKLPAGVALTFNDDVTYTEPGCYFYYGIVTDSDHYPSADTGLLVIEKKDILFDLLDTTATWNGKGQMVDVNNPENADFVTVVIDRKNNVINIVLDEDAQYALNAVAKLVGVEFDGDVQMSTILEKYNGKEVADAIVKLIDEAQKLELPDEIQKVLSAVKAELETLPTSGTIIVNGELPTELGVYEIYAISYSQHFKTTAAEAELEIVPVRVEVILNEVSKTYGEDDPELTYTVKYYDHEGNEMTGVDANVTAQISREAGEDVGTYAITGTVTLGDNIHFELIKRPDASKFTITEAIAKVTEEPEVIENLIYSGQEQNLIVGGNAVGGTLVYSLSENGPYTESIPVGKDAGDYTVYYKVLGDGKNYTDSEVKSMEVTIAKAASQIKEKPKAKELVYNGENQALVEPGTAEGGKLVYSLSENGPFSEEIPVGKEVGTYTVYYKVEGDNNHNDSEVQRVTVTIKENHTGEYPVDMSAFADHDTIKPGATVDIDGTPYVLDDNCTAWVEHTDAKIVTTYKYHQGNTANETYPTNMYVWYLTTEVTDNDQKIDKYNAERIPELDNLFEYNGTSIRVGAAKNGIRFFTSMDPGARTSLQNGTLINTSVLKGAKLVSAGTVFKKNPEVPVTLKNGVSSDVYGGKAGSSFRVFSTVKSRDWFTGMLVGLETDAATINAGIAARPYAKLQIGDETVVIYGGQIQRSIYYVACQNQNTFAQGSAYDNFVEGLIAKGKAGK